MLQQRVAVLNKESHHLSKVYHIHPLNFKALILVKMMRNKKIHPRRVKHTSLRTRDTA